MVNNKTRYCKTVSQSTGANYVTWSNLNNIKTSSSGAYAVSSVLIKKKGASPNRPSSITCTDFDFNLPVGAEPTRVIVEYSHKKTGGSDVSSKYPNHMCNIAAPTISLVGVSGFSGKGTAPTTDFELRKKSFNVTGKLSRNQINSSSFGCKVDYPRNSNDYNGYMSVGYVRVTVEYKNSSYKVNVKRVNGGYNGDDYTIQLSITNVNGTGYNPQLTLSSPLGFSYKSSKGRGGFRMVSARSFTWDPKLGRKIGTSSINVTFGTDVSFPSGSDSYTGLFELSERLHGTTGSLSAVIKKKPPSEGTETEPESETITEETSTQDRFNHVTVDEEFEFIFHLTDEEMAEYGGSLIVYSDEFEEKVGNSWYGLTNGVVISPAQLTGNDVTLTLKATTTGLGSVDFKKVVYPEDVDICSFQFDIAPAESDLSVPFASLLTLSEEELDRLGSGYSYVAQTYLKHTTEDTFVRDWYKNNRIGVFNNPIEENITITTEEIDGETIEIITDTTDYTNLTQEEIINHAEYWSNTVSEVNEYDNLECEFPYNEDYPLYIIFTGDYPETTTYGYDEGNIKYTDPAIIEKTVYKEREDTGNYPLPIKNLITNDLTSTISIEDNNTSTPVIIYNYGLDDGYGSDENKIIRGFEVSGEISQTDEVVLTATLTNTEGISGQRSIILNPLDNDEETSFKLGGLGDLWGFKSTEIKELEDWEIQVVLNNILMEDVINANYGGITFTIYVEQLEPQNINVKVDDEDLSYYGAFIEDVVIPEGLDTNTSLLSIDGTDTNDAYRQNIREKTITLTLTIDDCDLKTNTDMLRQLTKLLINDRDEYNRPIPRHIQFSHYPDIYFEYIMEKSMDITNEAGGYTVKAELVVPAGTGYTVETSATNVYGFVQGLAAINPIITLKPQGDEITIKELISEQTFTMGYSGDWQSGIVEINCEDRIVLLKTSEDDNYPLDISKYVDFNSDWFRLHGEYSFSSTGCVIRTVEYQERW